MAGNANPRPGKSALLMSIGQFGGFHVGKGRLGLGWIAFSSVPQDVEQRLQLAAEEIESLKAEIDRRSRESQLQIESLREENAALEAKVSQAAADKSRLEQALTENDGLKDRLGRLSKESEQQLKVATAENERLRALMERVSSGVR